MYFSKRTHFLSTSIMAAALIRLFGAMTEGIIRAALNRSARFAPDMLDSFLWKIQTGFCLFKAAAIIAVFYLAWKKLTRSRNLIDEDDRSDLGALQREVFGKELSSLSVDSIEQLLLIWSVILGGAECIYFISSMIYRQFTTQLMLLVVGGQQYDAFVPLYNLTHGFKYLEMMTAMLLGVTMTAIFLRDRYLNIASGVTMIVFLLAFSFFQMRFISLPGRQVGIVWTSVIYHLTETVGMFLLSFYLSKHYRGL